MWVVLRILPHENDRHSRKRRRKGMNGRLSFCSIIHDMFFDSDDRKIYASFTYNGCIKSHVNLREKPRPFRRGFLKLALWRIRIVAVRPCLAELRVTPLDAKLGPLIASNFDLPPPSGPC